MTKFEKSVSNDEQVITYRHSIDNSTLEVLCKLDGNEMEISFTVDGSTRRRSDLNQVAITRWLLMVWGHIQEEYGDVYAFTCIPTGGIQGWRSKVYAKLGFHQVSCKKMMYR